MATRTHNAISLKDGLMSISVDYDDVSGEVLTLRIVNNHPTKTLEAGFIGHGNGKAGRSREGSWGPGSGLVEISIPAPQRPQMEIVPDGGDPGREDYYDTIGNYEVWARMV